MSIQIPRTIDTFSNTRRNTKQMKRRACTPAIAFSYHLNPSFCLYTSFIDILHWYSFGNPFQLHILSNHKLENWEKLIYIKLKRSYFFTLKNIFKKRKSLSVYRHVSSLPIVAQYFLTLNQERNLADPLISSWLLFTRYTVGYFVAAKGGEKIGKEIGRIKRTTLDIASGHC